ncbi:transcription factor [Colletotrichum karsti]|uniref:Transcription factor n=1 Tax=Colletotrichum karsti TaxID=1095194 RepID=A0A9P6I094_9PEZI|nr:transcription factor [Colletotrichum karsti]KAF9873440.1 transcription factor [Colletotrichum karsti]
MPPSSTKQVKKISCKRCQYRKLKCSRTEPCPNCVTAKTTCEYREVDRKRVPVSHEYVASLESRLSWFESFIKNLRAATPDQREEMLNSATPDEDSAGSKTNPPSEYVTQLGISSGNQANLELGLEGSLVYHGATSIFRTKADQRQTGVGDLALQGYYDGVESNFESVMEHFGISMDDEVVMKSLTQFFRWQYPHFMFIYREAFLRDHFGDRKKGKYWSSALLLSICALGALVSLETKASSDQFFLAAESIIMVTGLTRPSIATVQAFLCLAFYEIGRGNLSKGWGYSGIAFRMAQDLGFQRDPKDWVQHDSSLATSEDVEIRRRIYWGCYISDKLISLVLGRPVYLVYEEAEVQPMETLPEPPEMALWRPVGFDNDYTEFTKATSMIPYLHEQIRLSRIIERMMSTLFSPRSHLDAISRRICFDNINLELNRWRETLPDFAKWQKWGPSSKPIPGVLALQQYSRSKDIDLFSCDTCSTILFARGTSIEEQQQPPWATTGALSNSPGLVKYASHMFLDDTVDGGAALWLPKGDREHTVMRFRGQYGESEQVPLSWPEFDPLVNADPPASTSIYCHYPAMLKFKAVVDTSDSSRAAMGTELAFWACAPLSHVTFEGQTNASDFPSSIDTLRESVNDSEDTRFGTLKHYKSSSGTHQYFCGKCAASVFCTIEDQPGTLRIAVGLLDDPNGARAEDLLSWDYVNVEHEQDAVGDWRKNIVDAAREQGKQYLDKCV